MIVVESGGFGLQFIVSSEAVKKLPKLNSPVKIFCAPCVNKDGVELYGFLAEKEKELFDMLNSAPGIGPKSAMALLNKFSEEKLFSIINENRADLLSEIGGMGEKRSQRLILELKNKIKKTAGGGADFLEENEELSEVLKALGYKQKEIGEALKKLPPDPMKLEERLKKCLALLKK